MVYSLQAAPRTRKLSRRWRNRFKMGHAIHDMLQKSFHEWAADTGHDLQFVDEVKIMPRMQELAATWDIHSACDGIFSMRNKRTRLEEMRVMLEIKSISKDDYAKLKAPKPEHVEQAHLYMACLDVPFVWFLYWCKGDQNYSGSHLPEFLIPFDPEVWSRLEERMSSAHKHKMLNTLPPKEEGFNCEFCAFQETCKPDYLYRPNVRPQQHLPSLKGRP